MPWKPAYVTLEAVKNYLSIEGDDESQDTNLTRNIEAASRAVDRECRRQFGRSDAPVTRTYTPQYDPIERVWFVSTDDVAQTQSVPIVVSGDNGSGEYASDLSAAVEAYPENASADGVPVRGFLLGSSAPSKVRVTAVFGWDAVPVVVEDAVLLQLNRLAKRKEAPFGIAGSPSGDGETRLLSKLDAGVALMLRGVTRRWSAA